MRFFRSNLLVQRMSFNRIFVEKLILKTTLATENIQKAQHPNTTEQNMPIAKTAHRHTTGFPNQQRSEMDLFEAFVVGLRSSKKDFILIGASGRQDILGSIVGMKIWELKNIYRISQFYAFEI